MWQPMINRVREMCGMWKIKYLTKGKELCLSSLHREPTGVSVFPFYGIVLYDRRA